MSMSKHFFRCAAVISIVLSLVSGCGKKPKAEGPLAVAAGLPPVAFLASRIGGEAVVVSTMLPEGRSPHDYSPAPHDVLNASRSRIFLTTGMNFEKTLCRPLDSTKTTVCDVTEGVRRIPMAPGHAPHGNDHDHDALDPHVWLDFDNLGIMANNICKAFCAADPDNDALYRANTIKFVGECRIQRQLLAAQLAPFRGRCFYVYHPAFGYFANMFGLRQEAVEMDGREVTPAHLAELTRRVKGDRVGVIFVQPQFNPSAMRALQRQLRVEVKTADPLRRDVLKNIQELVSELRMAFTEYDSK